MRLAIGPKWPGPCYPIGERRAVKDNGKTETPPDIRALLKKISDRIMTYSRMYYRDAERFGYTGERLREEWTHAHVLKCVAESIEIELGIEAKRNREAQTASPQDGKK